MGRILRAGQPVDLRLSETSCTVEGLLGAGGRGEVYKVDLRGFPLALRWYFPHYAQQDARLRERLDILIEARRPGDRFLWPQEMASASGVPAFGQVMALREPRFKGMVDLVKRRAQPTLRALARAGFELAAAFRDLHAAGFCYRAVTIGTLFVDPATGEVRLCDTDNIDVQGMPAPAAGEVSAFMAPELVRGAGALDARTDLYALSVLLFYLLVLQHTLEGKREANAAQLDDAIRARLYGHDPLFVFDPGDRSNELLSGYQDHDRALALWQLYPGALRDLFTRAFTGGLRDPRGRVTGAEWQAAMVRLHDAIFYCPSCNDENCYDGDAFKRSGGQPGPCRSCGARLRLPPRIRIGPDVVMLNPGARLYPHHIGESAYDFSRPVAEVARHPTNPHIAGLKNLSDRR